MFYLLPNFTQNVMIILCSDATRRRDTHDLSAPHLPHNWRYSVEIVTGANWNMCRCDFTTIKSHGSF